MKKRFKEFSKRLMAGVLAAGLAITGCWSGDGVNVVEAADTSTGRIVSRVSDGNTSDRWTTHFGEDVKNTEFAGGVWTDKSVYTDDTLVGDNRVSLENEENFLVSLSTIASTQTVTGMANTPTDVMMILDLSSSMYSGYTNRNTGTVDKLLKAVNTSIEELHRLNANNRVGVTIYYGTGDITVQSDSTNSMVLLPLGRYEKGTNASYPYLKYTTNSGKLVSVETTNGLKYEGGGTFTQKKRTIPTNAAAGTYAQLGILDALNQFLSAKTVTDTGEDRFPIFMFMSDGKPTAGSENYTVKSNSTMGNNQEINRSDNEVDFVTQLTAAYAKARVDEHYVKYTPQFYTLGLGENDDVSAELMDPAHNTTSTINNYWNTLVTTGSVSFKTKNFKDWDDWNDEKPSKEVSHVVSTVKLSSGKAFPSSVNQRLYVDQAFTATNADGLSSVFESIVNAINLQTRFYPTLTDTDLTSSGNVSFLDRIGEYMTVTDVKGILIGTHLYSGQELAKNFVTGGQDLGTFANPKPLGVQFRRAVMNQLGINTDEAGTALIDAAYDSGQLKYTSDSDYSNYIGWYADENNSYLGHWSESSTSTKPVNAKYYIKSYFYLGTVNADEGVLSGSDMMYTNVWVRTDIDTGEEAVIFSVPASLIPTVTYKVELDKEGNPTSLDVDGVKKPIELVYEVGLREDINQYNIYDKVDAIYLANNTNSDGSVNFYTNQYQKDGSVGYNTVNTYSYFHPSRENVRYYYQQDTDVLKWNASTGKYEVCKDASLTTTTSEITDYYRAYTVYTADDDGNVTAETKYRNLSKRAVESAKKRTDGSWYIAKGNVHVNTSGYSVDKTEDNTGTLDFANEPYVDVRTSVDDTGYNFTIGATLGNNGKAAVMPAQSKDISISRPNEASPANPTIINHADGQPVTIGDKLTYTIMVHNTTDEAADVVAKDPVPAGTKYVSHTNNTYDTVTGAATSTATATPSGTVNMVTWNFVGMAAGASTTVTMTVEVTEAALDSSIVSIENTATVGIGNNVLYETNTIDVPPIGKKVEALTPNANLNNGIKVGQELRYTIEYANTSGGDNATVTITDTIPEGTTLRTEDIYPAAEAGKVEVDVTENNGRTVIKWTLHGVKKDATGTANFAVVVNEDAETPVENEAIVKIGDNSFTTNATSTKVLKGDLSISKTVNNDYYIPTVATEAYQLRLTTRASTVVGLVTLSDTFDVQSSISANNAKYADYQLEFVNGTASRFVPKAGTSGLSAIDLMIAPGEKLTIKGLPAGLEVIVEEIYVLKLDASGNPIESSRKTPSQAGYTVSGTGVHMSGAVDTYVAVDNAATINIAISNTYKPTDAVYRFIGTKKLIVENNSVIGTTQFDMGIWSADANGNAVGKVLATTLANVDSTTDGSSDIITFKSNTITAAEVLAAPNKTLVQNFVVKEIQTSMIGVTFDTTEYHVEVTTKDDGEGKLVSGYRYRTRTAPNAQWGAWTSTTPTQVPDSGDIALVKNGATNNETFENKFAPLEYTLNLTGKKVLTGRDMAAGEFTYVVRAVEGTGSNQTERDVATGSVAAAASGADAQITFTSIKFQKAGTYIFKVYEIDNSRSRVGAGVTYDTAVFTVTVKIKQSEDKTKLVLDGNPVYTATRAGNNTVTGATVPNVSGITFNNTYGTFELEGTKVVKNSDGTVARILNAEYDFVMYEVVTDAEGTKEIPVGGGSHVAEEGQLGSNGGAAQVPITFDPINYSVTTEELAKVTRDDDIVKTLTYRIKEIRPTAGLNPTMNYDDTVWTVTVPIRYDWDTGKVYVTKSEITYTPNDTTMYPNQTYNTAEFTNVQHPNSVRVELKSLLKKTESNGTIPDGLNFSFAVKPVTGTNVVPVSVGTVTGSATEQEITFTPITYTARDLGDSNQKEFYYWIEENPAAGDGVTIDSKKLVLKVTLTRGTGAAEGELSTSVEYLAGTGDDYTTYTSTATDADKLFTNTYSASGQINVTVKKTYTEPNNQAATLEANKFIFRMERLNNDDLRGTGVYINATNDASGNVKFATITYDNSFFTTAGDTVTRYYKISEVNSGERGYTYSDAEYILEVKLTRGATSDDITIDAQLVNQNKQPVAGTLRSSTTGNLGLDLTSGDNAVVFANSYAPVQPGSISIVAEKHLTGRNLVDSEFTFDLFHIVDGDINNTKEENVKFLDSESVIIDATDKSKGTITFLRHYPVTVDTGVDGKTYVYMIKERNEGRTGIVYDETPVYAYVRVRDDNGSIVASLHNSKEDAEKVKSAADLATANAIDTANGKTLTDSFQNIYATYTPVASKNMIGRTLSANGFSFEVHRMTKVDSDNYTLGNLISTGTNDDAGRITFAPLHFSQAGTDYYYQISETRGTNGAVKYDDTKYYLKVSVNANGAITASYYTSSAFDTAAPIIVHVITQEGNNTADVQEAIVFTNEYEANGTIHLLALKEFTGRNTPMTDAEFTFEIRTHADRTSSESKLVAGGKNQVDANGDGKSNVTFGLLSYTEENYNKSVDGETVTIVTANKPEDGYIHTYYMMEIPKDTAATGITYSNAVYKIDVTVKDEGFGVLSTSATYTRLSGADGAGNLDVTTGLPVFANTYKADPAEFTLDANKSLLGKTLKESFAYTVKQIISGQPEASWAVVATGVNDASSGQVIFDADSTAAGVQNMKVSTAGTHNFIIEESDIPNEIVEQYKNDGIFTKDTTKYLAKVLVSDDNLGQLQVDSITYYKWDTDLQTTEAGTAISSGGFVNNYAAKPITVDLDVEINAKKTVTGKEYDLQANEFEFVVTDSRGTTVATGTNKAGAKDASTGIMTADIDFGEFIFSGAAEYRYMVSEIDTGKTQFTYDARQWEIRIDVKYDYDSGKLYVNSVNTYQIISRTTSMTETDPVFNNIYNPSPTAIVINATKELTGLRNLRAGEFTFRVIETISSGVDIVRAEAKNDATGKIAFTFSESIPGTHAYKIVEVIPADEEKATGVTYDDMKYLVTVEVRDNGQGQLQTDKSEYTVDDNTKALAFRNTYKALPVTAVITLNKVLHGTTLSADAFEFELLDDAGNAVQNATGNPITATNKADGTIVFDDPTVLKFSNVGTYTFKVREKNTGIANITYDNTTVEVTIDVIDQLDGNLAARVNYPADITFENTYTPPVTPTPTPGPSATPTPTPGPGATPTPTPVPGTTPEPDNTPDLDNSPDPGTPVTPADPASPTDPGTAGTTTTGDSSGVEWYIALLTVSLLAIAGVVVIRKKNKKV